MKMIPSIILLIFVSSLVFFAFSLANSILTSQALILSQQESVLSQTMDGQEEEFISACDFYKKIDTYDNGLVTTPSITVDWRAGDSQKITLGASQVSIKFINPAPEKRIFLELCQDKFAGRDVIEWDKDIVWSGGATTTQSSKPNTCDIITFYTHISTTSTLRYLGNFDPFYSECVK